MPRGHCNQLANTLGARFGEITSATSIVVLILHSLAKRDSTSREALTRGEVSENGCANFADNDFGYNVHVYNGGRSMKWQLPIHVEINRKRADSTRYFDIPPILNVGWRTFFVTVSDSERFR
jgi:hypothetical protein